MGEHSLSVSSSMTSGLPTGRGGLLSAMHLVHSGDSVRSLGIGDPLPDVATAFPLLPAAVTAGARGTFDSPRHDSRVGLMPAVVPLSPRHLFPSEAPAPAPSAGVFHQFAAHPGELDLDDINMSSEASPAANEMAAGFSKLHT